MPRCPPSGTGVENEDPVDCSYGITVDYCGRKVCAKVSGAKVENEIIFYLAGAFMKIF